MVVATVLFPLLVARTQFIFSPMISPKPEPFRGLVKNMWHQRSLFTGLYAYMGYVFSENLHRSAVESVEDLDKVVPQIATEFAIGCGTYILSYPFLTVSTNQQLLAAIEKRSLVDTARLIWNYRGLTGFYDGFGVHLLKIIPNLGMFLGVIPFVVYSNYPPEDE
mmetsp:Transcript_13035/g.16322  ORF Transcript_13035/g.16322 Transcript_13035/m.16322 type:complete len:164 (-) Transcript_13035:1194-1685(-)